LVSLWMYSHYARAVDPDLAGGLTDVASVGFAARGAYGKTLGYGLGIDLEAGLSFPLGFAHAARLYPTGLVLMLGDNTFAGVYGGIGVTGAGEGVPTRFQLPAELRLEVDVARGARVGARFSAAWYPGSDVASASSRLIPFADEILMSTFVR